MQKLILWMALITAVMDASAQTISRRVVSTNGGTLTGGSNIITYTIGETVIPTLTAGGNSITQGFQQPGEQITTGTIISPPCTGAVSVPYTAIDMGAGNIFAAQLSDASGSFASPVTIGSVASSSSGTIAATIPSNTPAGNGYRIRVVGSNPPVTGTDNGSNLMVGGLSVSIPDYYPVDPGGQPNTIYIGYYGINMLLNAQATGGILPYRYDWSTGSNARTIIVSPSIPGTYVYTVTVTDKKGCQVTTSKTVTVLDIRCEDKPTKITICHDGQEMCVSLSEVHNRLRNGDILGSCPVTPTVVSKTQLPLKIFEEIGAGIKIYPNPNGGQFTVQLYDYKASKAIIQVINTKGVIVVQKTVLSITEGQMVSFNLKNQAAGMYYVKIISAEGIQTTKMVIGR